MSEENISLKEYMEKQLATMDTGVKDLRNAIERNTDLTEKTLIQATKTNGRATALEQWSNDAKKIIENNSKDINTLKNYRWWIIGIGAALTFTGWLALQQIVYTVVEKKSPKIVSDAVTQALLLKH